MAINSTITKITAYSTVDGQMFRLEQDAKTHIAELKLIDYLQRSGIGEGGDWSNPMLIKWILEHAQDLHQYCGACLGLPK